MKSSPLSLRLGHLLLERSSVEGLEQLERTQQVLGHGHDSAKVVKLAAVADVSVGAVWRPTLEQRRL